MTTGAIPWSNVVAVAVVMAGFAAMAWALAWGGFFRESDPPPLPPQDWYSETSETFAPPRKPRKRGAAR